MTVTIEKKTDQLNFEDFLGGVTRIVTIAGVKVSKAESQYDIAIEGDKRVWRPPPTVLKQLVEAWTDEATTWVGHRAELYGDPEVMMAGKKVGGIRVSRLSHIDTSMSLMLTTTRGQKGRFDVDPLPDAPAPTAATPADPAESVISGFAGMGVTVAQLEARLALPRSDWDEKNLAALRALGGELSRGEKRIEDEFAQDAS